MKLIPLTQGKFAMVDDTNYNWLSKKKWYASEAHGNWYAKSSGGKRNKKVLMHRLILGLTDPLIIVDHEDGNGLNNQEYNIRIATYAQNSQNAKARIGSSSKYVGVSWSKSRKKWEVQMHCNGVKIHIGRFDNEETAARAYDAAAKIHKKEFANFNFK